jgi:hypothetical protein
MGIKSERDFTCFTAGLKLMAEIARWVMRADAPLD